MIVQRDKLTADVRRAIDMNSHDERMLVPPDTDTQDMDSIIAAKALEAARQVLSAAPLRLLEGGHHIHPSIEWRGGGRGRFLLPEDFLRLLSFKMDDWAYAVSAPVPQESPAYALLNGPYPGLSGVPERPAVALVRGAEGLWLEFYSCRADGDAVSRCVYVPEPHWDIDGGLDVPRGVYQAVVLTTAALTCLAYSEGDKGKMLMELAKAALV